MSQISRINECVYNSILEKQKLCVGSKMQEPDYVAALTQNFVKKMKGVIPRVNFGGVFIHQKPYARFGKTKCKSFRCEVGDLLVLCRKKIDGCPMYNVALIQWKKSDKKSFELSTLGEKNQYGLYSKWMEFYLEKEEDKGYDITPKTITPGAQYGLINERHLNSLYVSMPYLKMETNADYTFGRFVWNMMNWQTGRPIDSDACKTNDQWSKFIWALLRMTRNAVFTRSNIKVHKELRSVGDVFEDFMNNQSDSLVSTTSETPMGISVLLIDCGADMLHDDDMKK